MESYFVYYDILGTDDVCMMQYIAVSNVSTLVHVMMLKITYWWPKRAYPTPSQRNDIPNRLLPHLIDSRQRLWQLPRYHEGSCVQS